MQDEDLKDRTVAGFLFVTHMDAELARFEVRRISKIENLIDIRDPHSILEAYNMARDDEMFRTPLGLEYLHTLYTALERSSIDPRLYDPIPIRTPITKPKTKKPLWKKKPDYRLLGKISNGITAGLVLVIFVVLGVFWVTPTGKITAYKRNLADAYATWEQDIALREKNVRARELALSGNTEEEEFEEMLAEAEPEEIAEIDFSTPVSLEVPLLYQKPELPEGCEVTSLTMVLNYLGVDVDKCTLSDSYLPKTNDLKGDPNLYYLGNPKGNGYYCYAPVLVKTVEAYNEENGTSLKAEDLTGCNLATLYTRVEEGNPVIVWGTLQWEIPKTHENGLYDNLHCMVLSGYSEDTVTITDSIYGLTTVDRATFEIVWYAMGQMAMTVTE